MKKIDDKRKQINNIVSVVKLASLLFSGMGIFNFIINKYNITRENLNYTLTMWMIIFSILILILIYAIWAFSTAYKFNEKYVDRIQVIENLFFVCIFFVVLFLTGVHESEFKFLFLFIIITSTIQVGMEHGMLIATISSVIILIMDLFYGTTTGKNIYFEKDLIIVGIFILTSWTLGLYVNIESEYIERLQSLANKDGLTEVYNHRFFQDALKTSIKLCEDNKESISLIFIDIDYFKHYNDLYGHQKGDEVLKNIGAILRSSVRKEDIVARYGGEEFAIILPNTLEKDAIAIAERIRLKIENTYFEGEENQPNGKLTASIGISIFPDKADCDVELIKSADDALYRAKFFNRNRVEAYYSILDELKKDIKDKDTEEKDIEIITSIKTLISVINAKDKYTYGHIERVVIYSKLLGDKLGLKKEDKKNLRYGAYMHDIGKISILEDILNKKMKLTNEEWEILKQHPMNGVEIIKPVEALNGITDLILHHHERYDGQGYPSGLKGKDIPYLARILTVVDSFDAMTSNRPYSIRKTHDEAIEELKRCKGTQFDPEITDAFIDIITKNKDITYL
ncbi:diguanylate cyclase (GGDEF) domain-containing protein [Clostridium cavendishii DSM 21758]|uniref:Diguanylate cyclase (GGDEF) domain-containing protein n=1 Tax=Clostridium cavendishii DSM 21758 TaxID=1121302 RepID=A0A1M6HY99_9CLOT|nr:diguanylate cyclase [Clostridium cavendishii]SHJ27165.1 diguanylate cyclase (GGDEF) domain-containing protein [Clostridium cavendishii DSM 21758]